MASRSFPPLAPFPTAAWRNHLLPEEWDACLDAWLTLAGVHLSLPASDFLRTSAPDVSLPDFLSSYVAETAGANNIPSSESHFKMKQLRKDSFLLSQRLLELKDAPKKLCQWEFLADLSKVYGRELGQRTAILVWKNHLSTLELSIASLKSHLIKELDAGITGDLKTAESQLKRLNYLLHVSPQAAAFFMAGSDFVDSLISCYKIMNPPLRKLIISTTYLCLIGLTEGDKPSFSSLVDQLYSLRAAAEAHKARPTSPNDSLVPELVTVTPILKQIQQRIDASGSGSNRAKSVLSALEVFRKAGAGGRPARPVKNKANKGKGIATNIEDDHENNQLHVHRVSLVSQVQDLFPDFGSGFIVKLLDEYNDNVEQVIAHLLEGSLPTHLKEADQSEEL